MNTHPLCLASSVEVGAVQPGMVPTTASLLVHFIPLCFFEGDKFGLDGSAKHCHLSTSVPLTAQGVRQFSSARCPIESPGAFKQYSHLSHHAYKNSIQTEGARTRHLEPKDVPKQIKENWERGERSLGGTNHRLVTVFCHIKMRARTPKAVAWCCHHLSLRPGALLPFFWICWAMSA
jgi:hypothetical protein